jgi:deoxyribodipyrimidine photo-lyase
MPHSPAQAAPAILWCRRDFRLEDNPALQAALAWGGPIIPVYIHAPHEYAPWEPGEASNWWRHESLKAFGASLEALGSRLIYRHGNSQEQLEQLLAETGAKAVFWNRLYEPQRIAHDTQIKSALKNRGIEAKSFNAALLNEPHEIRSKSTGGPFKVFTPFWKHVLSTTEPAPPISAPKSLPSPASWPASEPLESLRLFPRLDWWKGLAAAWEPGEAAGLHRLRRFLDAAVLEYGTGRDTPGIDGTGRLSPYLHFGELSPRTVFHEARQRYGDVAHAPQGVYKFLAEIGWREFAYHLLGNFPQLPQEPLNERFTLFPWEENPEGLRAWQQGRTGFPIVDAGMRQLYETGWMHNRVRMIVGSFLVKDLRIHWLAGARWFWDTLVDADLASNSMGWQWVAGCGADAAPYFRVFNPISQGEKFDPEGHYIRRYIPQLGRVPKVAIHQPWELPGVRGVGGSPVAGNLQLGKDYPEPIVDHAQERLNALAAYGKVKVPKDSV